MWDVRNAAASRTYALTYAEALEILERKGHTRTDAWTKGRYSISKPGVELLQMLEPYLMKPSGWHERIFSAAKQKQLKTA